MEIKGTLQPRDIKIAVWLNIGLRTPFGLTGSIFVLAFYALMVWATFFGPSSQRSSLPGWEVVLPGVLLCYFFLRLPSGALRNYRRRKAMQCEFRLTVSDKGLEFRNENGHMTLPWSDYHNWQESNALYVLSPADGMFSGVIPKRFFQSQADLDTFREMLRANLVER